MADKGVDLGKVNIIKEGALHGAIWKGNIAMARYLLKAGVSTTGLESMAEKDPKIAKVIHQILQSR